MPEGFKNLRKKYGPLMTADEAAEVLKCTRKHVYSVVDENPSLKIQISERCIRIDRDKFFDWIANGGISNRD